MRAGRQAGRQSKADTMRKQDNEDSSTSSSVRLLLYDHHQDRNYVVLHPLNRPPHKHRNLLLTILLSALLFTTILIYLLFPSDPSLSLARIRINFLDIITHPHIFLDLSLSLTLHIRNRDFFSLDYSSLQVSVGYRGKELGSVISQGGLIPARATSYVNATLDLDGLEVIHDAVYLIADLARGFVPFDTHSHLTGSLDFFFFRFPIKGKIACEVFVNTKNQTIMHQACHLE